ncbi:MAG: winged helix DNA-binding domain-containing protein [Flavobacteriales bacterium]
MTAPEIIAHRLANQHLIGAPLGAPGDVVRHFAAMQAQDYAGAKWAVGQRCAASDADVEALFNDGAILRTHLCRPTWHFVLAEDIRWILELTAPRVHQANAFMARKRGLDVRLLRRATDIIAKALVGGKHLERDKLMALLNSARIDTTDNRSSHFIMYAELEGVVCSGPRVGKQFTYALLDERAPRAKRMGREEAIAELTRRYFTSRGPATLHDLTLWSGLTMADAKKGIALVGEEFARTMINERENWYPHDTGPMKLPASTVHLLPNYDEYGIGYKDRSAFYDPSQALAGRNNPVFRHLLLLNGRMVGTWDRTLAKKSVSVLTSPFAPLKGTAARSVHQAMQRFARFLELPLSMSGGSTSGR